MEHGVLAEARVRALLLERFWVLARSVDVQGADFLVQLRPETLAVLDEPIRLGRVQSKFVQDEGGAVHVAERYVRDRVGQVYPQFFLLITSGEPDAEQFFLLSADQIATDFKVSKRGEHRGAFRIPANRLLRGSSFEVKSRSVLLDRIEHAMVTADRAARARFLGPGYESIARRAPLDPDYRLPLMNWYGDFEPLLDKIKYEIEIAEMDMEDALRVLRRILRSGDPLEVESLLEDDAIHGFLGATQALSFALKGAFDQEFFDAARDYRERLRRIRAVGKENAFVGLAAATNGEIRRMLRRRGWSAGGKTLRWSLEFEATSLRLIRLESKVVAKPHGGGGPVGLYLDADPIVEVGHVTIAKNLMPYPPWSATPRPGESIPAVPTWASVAVKEASAIGGALLRLVEDQIVGED